MHRRLSTSLCAVTHSPIPHTDTASVLHTANDVLYTHDDSHRHPDSDVSACLLSKHEGCLAHRRRVPARLHHSSHPSALQKQYIRAGSRKPCTSPNMCMFPVRHGGRNCSQGRVGMLSGTNFVTPVYCAGGYQVLTVSTPQPLCGCHTPPQPALMRHK